MEFISVGKCLKSWEQEGVFHYLCHFKGYYKSFKVKQIHYVTNQTSLQLQVGENYIVHAQMICHIERELHARIRRIRNINEIRLDFL